MVRTSGQAKGTLVAIAACLVPSMAAAGIGREVLSGRALIRTDEQQRIVVALDTDRDGNVDQLFLFNPYESLVRPIAPMAKDVDLSLEDDRLVVTAGDGSVKIDVKTALPTRGEPATSVRGTTISASGLALVRFRLDRAELPERIKLSELDTSDYHTLEVSPICGGSDADCTSGGRGSTGCSGGCESGGGASAGMTVLGNGANFGQNMPSIAPCTASCGGDSYACCRCDNGASNPSPIARCTCRATTSLQPCPTK